MWQVEQTKLLKLPHVYLGYWIGQSPKMAYKNQFGPHQVLIDGRWQTPPADQAVDVPL
jgi:arginine-tRNA-protein transferase